MKSSSRVVHSELWFSLAQLSYVVIIMAFAAHFVSSEPNSLVSFLSIGVALLIGQEFRKWSYDEFFSNIRERQPLSPICDAISKIAFVLSGLVLISTVLRPLSPNFADVAAYAILCVIGVGLRKMAFAWPQSTHQSRSPSLLERVKA